MHRDEQEGKEGLSAAWEYNRNNGGGDNLDRFYPSPFMFLLYAYLH